MSQSSCSLEETLDKACRSVSQCCSESYDKAEESIRTAPVASVLFATATGYILHLLPVGRIVFGLARLLLAMVKPAIFIFGIWKVADYVRSQCPAKAEDEPGRDAVIDSPVGPNV